MDEDNIITLNDENGNEVEFEFLDLIPYRQNEYVVLLPIGDSDGQVVILQLKEIDDETEEYVGVENEFVLETVLGQFTRNYTQTVKRAADNTRRYAPGEGSIPPVLLSRVSKGGSAPFGTRLCGAKCSVLYALSALP